MPHLHLKNATHTLCGIGRSQCHSLLATENLDCITVVNCPDCREVFFAEAAPEGEAMQTDRLTEYLGLLKPETLKLKCDATITCDIAKHVLAAIAQGPKTLTFNVTNAFTGGFRVLSTTNVKCEGFISIYDEDLERLITFIRRCRRRIDEAVLYATSLEEPHETYTVVYFNGTELMQMTLEATSAEDAARQVARHAEGEDVCVTDSTGKSQFVLLNDRKEA